MAQGKVATDQQDVIAALVAAGLTPDAILALAVTAKRKDRDVAEAAVRPTVTVTLGKVDLMAIQAYALRAKDDLDAIETDRACALVRDAVAANDVAALLFALLRLWRSIWFQIPHLGEM
jgi:hypothetical protein